MRVGVVFPQTEIGNDPGVIREFAQTVEALGYHYLLAYEHVVGAPPDRLRALGVPQPPYTHESPFHEPFVLFGYLSAVTSKLELATGIVILPQRQTVLVAKQAAEVDVLSRGRLRLGVGLGWNPVEYEALGANFRDRGRRVEEQITLLRLLWTQELVEFEGRHHRIRRAGLNPLPVQRPIPIWMGGSADRALRRIARIADGWISQLAPTSQAAEVLDRVRGYVREAGRDPDRFGIEGRVHLGTTPEDRWPEAVRLWRALGGTHLSVNTMRSGFRTPEEHLEALRRFREAFSELP
ncbi:MAG: LLM class F420-dependent oxidoreductase [Armatimonadota bacterium]|nr:LLM class F420-dependent oxidoreductase [Armatimonadota bacterium]MDR7443034.1 LLM class F420-dependent oxidoreductase [Armatimonadota bacterium]MDR7569363.1 LLM class F420-dependent oxidoreductase [Armatimonadota bacterium]MDR7614512.1 LLM class F420-dependent oxidoreductase [Armatimonadota bacterium]